MAKKRTEKQATVALQISFCTLDRPDAGSTLDKKQYSFQ